MSSLGYLCNHVRALDLLRAVCFTSLLPHNTDTVYNIYFSLLVAEHTAMYYLYLFFTHENKFLGVSHPNPPPPQIYEWFHLVPHTPRYRQITLHFPKTLSVSPSNTQPSHFTYHILINQQLNLKVTSKSAISTAFESCINYPLVNPKSMTN